MGDPRERVTFSWGDDRAADWAILVHGGAGDVRAERIPVHVEGCRAAAAAGAAVLRAGGSALDAVQRAVEVLEENPAFNAGLGACLTDAGTIELDASIMEGEHLRAGGVCALPPFLHPIAVARRVLDAGRHVLYADRGAEAFAVAQGFVRAGDDELVTDAARERLRAVRAAAAAAQPAGGEWAGGTVGAVARDVHGHVAAATSTGGMVGKRPGRVGDSPILGAGNYADDERGACSNTGNGEAMMRVCLAKTAVDLLHDGTRPEDAARAAIATLVRRVPDTGAGGTILVDASGRLGLARSTRTMTWAAARAREPDRVDAGA